MVTVLDLLEDQWERFMDSLYDQLKEMVNACETDVAKAESGNKAAGTRVRKSMQEIKKQADSIRKAVLELRK